MKALKLFLLLAILTVNASTAQELPGNVCFIDHYRINYRIDRNWSPGQFSQLSELFGLDSALIVNALYENGDFVYDSVSWKSETLDDHIILLSRELDYNKKLDAANDVVLMDEQYFENQIDENFYEPPQVFGYNRFSKKSQFRQSADTAFFFLRKHSDAQYVYLSGSFNNWSTGKLPMTRTTDGWKITVPLKPGRHLYKYIVDGRWISDPDNKNREWDGHGGFNSVVFIENHLFYLKGYDKAKVVALAGSFNNWQFGQIKMNKSSSGWVLPVFLPEGTHFYKYIVDGNWITDPANGEVREDAFGNLNSLIAIGDTVLFTLAGYRDAQKVVLSGSFNNWSHNELPMYRTEEGWQLPYAMAPGVYEYKFIVDGKWITDPQNSQTTGTGEFMNSIFTFKPNVTFVLRNFAQAKRVIVTGSFNNWNQKAYDMTKVDDTWYLDLFLKPGKYTYKFIVDDSWMIDPENPVWEDNEFGTGNSVLWVEP